MIERTRRRIVGSLGVGLLLVLLGATAIAADPGVDAYQQEEYAKARDLYEKYTAENPEDLRGEFNLGTTLHRTGEFDPAEDALKHALATDDPALKSRTFYNLGNTQVKKGDLQSALESYKMALRFDPHDEDAKINLELVDQLLQDAPPDSSAQQEPGEDSEDQGDSEDQEQQDHHRQPAAAFEEFHERADHGVREPGRDTRCDSLPAGNADAGFQPGFQHLCTWINGV